MHNLVGNAIAKQCLQRIIESGAIAHAILFAGPEGVGKDSFAHAFAQEVIRMGEPAGTHDRKLSSGNHPDIHHYVPEGKLGLHSRETIGVFSSEVFLPPHDAQKKVFVIYDAERMLPDSANALLKTFEEPSTDTVIILVTNKPDAIIPTIRSRCRCLTFSPLTEDEVFEILKRTVKKDDDELRRMAQVSRGSLHRARMANDTIRKTVNTLLSQGGNLPYHIFTQYIETLAKHISEHYDDDPSRHPLWNEDNDALSAIQRHHIQKKQDGLFALQQQEYATIIFDYIVIWYRDAILATIDPNSHHIINTDAKHLPKNITPPHLNLLQKHISNAHTALSRSTSLTTTLIHLFLVLRGTPPHSNSPCQRA